MFCIQKNEVNELSNVSSIYLFSLEIYKLLGHSRLKLSSPNIVSTDHIVQCHNQDLIKMYQVDSNLYLYPDFRCTCTLTPFIPHE